MADLIDRDALLKDMGLTDAVKYGNKDAEQQYHSYSTMMLYEIADAIWDAPAVNRWIPCSERLPENRERVLVCFRSGTVHIAVWYGDYDEKGAWKVTSQFPTKLYRTDTIPKWMPMPEPPKGGIKDE